MLVLSGEKSERFIIGGGEIIVQILEVKGKNVRLGFTAHRSITIDREVVHGKRVRESGEASE